MQRFVNLQLAKMFEIKWNFFNLVFSPEIQDILQISKRFEIANMSSLKMSFPADTF